VERLDKAVIGDRIKFLRKSRGMRQWQMAKMLGATQPAIHKYENGILPEVKRLLEIARIGNTSIEWILTGRHWENGSAQSDRLATEVYHLAYRLQSLRPEDRRILEGALDLLQAAIGALRTGEGPVADGPRDAGPGVSAESLEAHAARPLAAALDVYDAVVSSLAAERIDELHRFGLRLADDGEKPTVGSGPPPPQKGSR
jgi:transcriptional regulator with XRE-family HTH domain